jgi:Na+/H+ antiporter NhaD/arsenite permease-like protein
VILANGKGKCLLLGIVAITPPICAVLPNATTVMLPGLFPKIWNRQLEDLSPLPHLQINNKIDTVQHILHDLDWSTLIQFMSIFTG